MMADTDGMDAGLRQLADHWGLVLAWGILSIILGILVVSRPVSSSLTVMLFVGIWVFVYGIMRIVQSFGRTYEHSRIWGVIVGILGIIVGAYLIRHPIYTAAIVAFLIGLFWFIQGFTELLTSITDTAAPHRGWMAFMGIIGILAGAYLIIAPAEIVVVVWVAGIFLMVYGAMAIGSAFALKKASGGAAAAA